MRGKVLIPFPFSLSFQDDITAECDRRAKISLKKPFPFLIVWVVWVHGLPPRCRQHPAAGSCRLWVFDYAAVAQFLAGFGLLRIIRHLNGQPSTQKPKLSETVGGISSVAIIVYDGDMFVGKPNCRVFAVSVPLNGEQANDLHNWAFPLHQHFSTNQLAVFVDAEHIGCRWQADFPQPAHRDRRQVPIRTSDEEERARIPG